MSCSVEFIDFYRVGFLLVPPIVPPNDFTCGVRGILSYFLASFSTIAKRRSCSVLPNN